MLGRKDSVFELFVYCCEIEKTRSYVKPHDNESQQAYQKCNVVWGVSAQTLWITTTFDDV